MGRSQSSSISTGFLFLLACCIPGSIQERPLLLLLLPDPVDQLLLADPFHQLLLLDSVNQRIVSIVLSRASFS